MIFPAHFPLGRWTPTLVLSALSTLSAIAVSLDIFGGNSAFVLGDSSVLHERVSHYFSVQWPPAEYMAWVRARDLTWWRETSLTLVWVMMSRGAIHVIFSNIERHPARVTPTLIGGVLSSQSVTAISTGDSFTLALVSSGAVYGWGSNTLMTSSFFRFLHSNCREGQLGLGDLDLRLCFDLHLIFVIRIFADRPPLFSKDCQILQRQASPLERFR